MVLLNSVFVKENFHEEGGGSGGGSLSWDREVCGLGQSQTLSRLG